MGRERNKNQIVNTSTTAIYRLITRSAGVFNPRQSRQFLKTVGLGKFKSFLFLSELGGSQWKSGFSERVLSALVLLQNPASKCEGIFHLQTGGLMEVAGMFGYWDEASREGVDF
jgi:hypothetical protein